MRIKFEKQDKNKLGVLDNTIIRYDLRVLIDLDDDIIVSGEFAEDYFYFTTNNNKRFIYFGDRKQALKSCKKNKLNVSSNPVAKQILTNIFYLIREVCLRCVEEDEENYYMTCIDGNIEKDYDRKKSIELREIEIKNGTLVPKLKALDQKNRNKIKKEKEQMELNLLEYELSRKFLNGELSDEEDAMLRRQIIRENDLNVD